MAQHYIDGRRLDVAGWVFAARYDSEMLLTAFLALRQHENFL